ncbi:tegument protein [Glossina pallidipes salivary gland hypertrophy virus]|uniref:Tegument protein n=2 Tax=Glossina hytrovirus (isolate Glossina pallidipes/Ethiopia/Seibersdorf/-) TaxID=379529 RepID=A0A0Y0KB89_GHVS|nr:hypothetical protein SGHV002 [Glossina pallidipes salivary gland hypertrophy virus]ABQ08776.1 hypothetical protein SGHV002 [Glossina pallidipes salivary gland hypertrophy virus]AMB48606.1 tegument protein [Glossina pallidipes salivary gland hypertrophy virus]
MEEFFESLGMSPNTDKLNKIYWDICFTCLKEPHTPIEITEELLIYFGYDGRYSVGIKSIMGILSNFEPAMKKQQQLKESSSSSSSEDGESNSYEGEEVFFNPQQKNLLTVTAEETMFIFNSLSTRMNKYFRNINRYYTRGLELIAKCHFESLMSSSSQSQQKLNKIRKERINDLKNRYKNFIEYYKETKLLNAKSEEASTHRNSILPYRKFFNEYDQQSTVYGNYQLVLRLYRVSETSWALIRRKNCSLTTAEKHLKKRFGENIIMVHQYIGLRSGINYGEFLQSSYSNLFIWHARENILESKQIPNKLTNKDIYEYLDLIIRKFSS